MSMQLLHQIADQLRKSNEYRVIQKYQKPLGYNLSCKDYNKNRRKEEKKLIGVFLDIEATGLIYSRDKLIELGMVKFEYTKDGYIFNILEEFNGYQDPKTPISTYITKLTGINDDMVKGHSIREDQLSEYLKDVSIIVAHNAQFDRAFFETAFPNISPKPWACSMRGINWQDEGINSLKLEYIAYRYNFFFEGHRAIIDCLSGIHILAQRLIISGVPVLQRLLDTSVEIEFKIWAKSAPYNSKDLLKARGYRWEVNTKNNYRAWSISIPKNNLEEEIKYLRSDIYKSNTTMPLEIKVLDAFNKYSISSTTEASVDKKYEEQLEWAKNLYKI